MYSKLNIIKGEIMFIQLFDTAYGFLKYLGYRLYSFVCHAFEKGLRIDSPYQNSLKEC